MLLNGSCHCGKVRFSVDSHTPQPYMRCYCSICRKTAGGGGYAINIMGLTKTLKVEGAEHLSVYHARGVAGDPDAVCPGKRHFCKHCGSALYIFDPRWAEWVYPFASAIDTPLPAPKERVHIMLESKPRWVRVPAGKHDLRFDDYPELSIEAWHKKHGVYVR